MIIKKIRTENFRQFKGIQTIEFSTNEDQNITLILGDNTSGKTTLLQAFLWGFYGTANFKSKDSLLNAEIAQELLKSEDTADVSISIELEHQGINYFIKRTLSHSNKSNKIVHSTISKVTMQYINEDGQAKDIPEHKVREKIEEILPEKLAIYFLYDTERFGNVSSREDVTNSVKQILGLTVLEKVIEYIGTSTRRGTVLQQFNSSLNLTEFENAQITLKRIEETEELLYLAQEKRTNKLTEIESYNDKIDAVKETIRSLEKTTILQTERDKKLQALNFEQSALKSHKENFYTAFQNNTLAFLGKNLFEKAIAELIDAKLDTKGISDMTANSIKDIIERGYCVCGSEICNGNESHKKLLEEIRFLPPESIGTLLKLFKEKIDMYTNMSNNYFALLESSHKYIGEANYKIGQIEDELQSINDELLNKDDIKKHQQKLMEYENKRRILTEDADDLKEKIGAYKNAIKSDRASYDKDIAASSKNKELLLYINYANEVLTWVKSRKTEREDSIKKQLEERVNYYFEKMYHGKRKVQIDEKFRVHLITTDLEAETHTDESQGLETVKNFAFISGLVDLAKQKLKDTYEKDAESYPLILDAPFSNADEKHVKNISEVLPNVANQLILIVMAKDWNYAKDALESRIGKQYYLDKKSEIYTLIKGAEEHANI